MIKLKPKIEMHKRSFCDKKHRDCICCSPGVFSAVRRTACFFCCYHCAQKMFLFLTRFFVSSVGSAASALSRTFSTTVPSGFVTL